MTESTRTNGGNLPSKIETARMPAPRPIGVAASREVQRAVAQAQAAILVALQNPRDEQHAIDRIRTAFSRPALASEALYSFPRGGSQVEGLSIRAAEELARSWRNIDFAVNELEQIAGESLVMAYAWDMEANVRSSKEFRVKHEYKARGKIKRLTDQRDIYEWVANQGSRRVRACILALIPADIKAMAEDTARRTQSQNVKVTDETVAALIENFAKLQVTREMIATRLGRRVDAETLSPMHLVDLRKIYISIRDEMSKPGDWFTVEEAPSTGSKIREQMAAQRASNGEKEKEEANEAPPPAETTEEDAKKSDPPKDPEKKPEPRTCLGCKKGNMKGDGPVHGKCKDVDFQCDRCEKDVPGKMLAPFARNGREVGICPACDEIVNGGDAS